MITWNNNMRLKKTESIKDITFLEFKTREN